MLDIFNTNAFGLVALTDAINSIKFVPGRIGALGLFNETSISTTTVAIEEKGGILNLVAPSPRGGVGSTQDKIKRTLRSIAVPHFELLGGLNADEVQGVRSWGSETETETAMAKVAEYMAIQAQSLEATHEYSRIGAVKGLITYADATTLDLFSTFGVTQIAERDWDLDNASPAAGILRKTCAAVIRQIAAELDGVPFSGIYALCGDAWFDDLIAHTEVRASYLQQQEASQLRTGYIDGGAGGSYGSFNFGGITFENYRGAVGATGFVNTDKCHVFPTGVPSLFRTYYAPADLMDTVNTMGQPMYAYQRERDDGKGLYFTTQMNALDICTRPRVLLQGKRT